MLLFFKCLFLSPQVNFYFIALDWSKDTHLNSWGYNTLTAAPPVREHTHDGETVEIRVNLNLKRMREFLQ